MLPRRIEADAGLLNEPLNSETSSEVGTSFGAFLGDSTMLLLFTEVEEPIRREAITAEAMELIRVGPETNLPDSLVDNFQMSAPSIAVIQQSLKARRSCTSLSTSCNCDDPRGDAIGGLAIVEELRKDA